MPRKAFLLRIDDKLLAALQRWADEDLRSLNGQLEYLLRQAVQKRGIKLSDPPPTDERTEDTKA